jgi:hypothetical protein
MQKVVISTLSLCLLLAGEFLQKNQKFHINYKKKSFQDVPKLNMTRAQHSRRHAVPTVNAQWSTDKSVALAWTTLSDRPQFVDVNVA